MQFKLFFVAKFAIEMKTLTIIISFLMLSIILKPCSDGFNTDHETLEIADQEEHDHSKDHDDSCSSLCVCNCCGIAITTIGFPFYEYKTQIQSVKRIANIYKPAYRYDFHCNIWQPPRLIT